MKKHSLPKHAEIQIFKTAVFLFCDLRFLGNSKNVSVGEEQQQNRNEDMQGCHRSFVPNF